MKFKCLLYCFFLTYPIFQIFAQEKLLSNFENYYDFLALDGNIERPYMNYRTLSDSKWLLPDTTSNIWSKHVYFAKNKKEKGFKLYGPESYISYNSKVPYGQNDGLLWQGRGLNSYLSFGVRYESRNLEITFKPELSFSANRDYLIVPPNSVFNNEVYNDKAKIYGYYGVRHMDAPQRFGDKQIIQFGLGDSEIRYTSKTFTLGFGTQYLWVGPTKLNPILHSNNAPSYPRFDIGFRPTKAQFGKWDAGLFEVRLFLGQLKESDFFDHDPTNNYRLFTGLSAAYAPSFIKGLTLSANRNFLCSWELGSLMSVADLFYIPGNIYGGRDSWDQRASVGISYLLPNTGFEIYSEIGLNDYSPGLDGYIRYPFHSMVHTSGLHKSFSINLFKQQMKGEFMLEVSMLEVSQDYQFENPESFYAHHQIKHGYTNQGQWLGAGNGTGGNSQYVGLKIYHKKGNMNLYFHRKNPDNDYIYQYSVGTLNTDSVKSNIKDFKAIVLTGVNSVYFVSPKIQLSGGISFIIEHNPLYNAIRWEETSKRGSLHLNIGIVYTFE